MKDARALDWANVATQEAGVIQRCLAGDESACSDLVEAHERMVFGLGLNLTGNREDAMEISQDVFLRVFRTLPTFQGRSALRTWIYRIVINQVRNQQRWWWRRHRAEQVSLEEHVQHHGDPPARQARAT